MLDKLKKESTSASVTRVVIALAIFVGILVWTKMGIFGLLLGPKRLDMSNPEAMAGKYVYYDADAILGSFSSLYKREQSGRETLSSVSYSAYDYDADIGFGIKRTGGKSSNKHAEMDIVIDGFWDYIDGVKRTAPEPVRIVGTLQPLSGEPLRHFDDWWEDVGLDVAPYLLIEGQVGGQDKILLIIVSVVALLAFIYAFYIVLRGALGKFDKNLQDYVKNNPQVTMAMMESDFSAAKQIGKRIWVGKRFTIYMSGIYAEIIDNEKLVWGYYYQRTGKNSVSQVRLFNIDKAMYTIDVSQKQSGEMLEEYGNRQPQMIIGYDKDLEKAYNKDFATFLSYRYNTAAAEKQYQDNQF